MCALTKNLVNVFSWVIPKAYEKNAGKKADYCIQGSVVNDVEYIRSNDEDSCILGAYRDESERLSIPQQNITTRN